VHFQKINQQINSKGETDMRRLSLIITVLLVLAAQAALAQQMRTTIVYTNGQGSSTNTDQGQATADATQTATNWANSSCIGIVTETNVTYSQCSPIGSQEQGNLQYVCTVNVKAKCEIQSRGR
jgi:hypothetical protein